MWKGKYYAYFILSSSLLGPEMHKCTNEFNPTTLNDVFTVESYDHHLRDSSRRIQQKFNPFKFGFKPFRYFASKLRNVLLIDTRQFWEFWRFFLTITTWCHSDAVKVLEKRMFWWINLLILHILIKVASRYFRPNCGFIMCQFLMLSVCLFMCNFPHAQFYFDYGSSHFALPVRHIQIMHFYGTGHFVTP